MTVQSAISEISSFLGERLSRSKSDLEIHGRNESYFPEAPPDAVAYPETTEEVSRILAICNAHGCPVIPWGTGTSLEGHSLAIRGGITVDFTRMNKVLALNAEDLDCVIQPGITRRALNEYLRDTGLFFPVDPGADAAIGGMAATRASGTTAVRYGTIKENVLALEVVLADGTVIRTGSRARKSSAGYDLTSLFVGSEGTLGLITELTLRLRGVPEAISAAVCSFPTVADAVDTVIETIQMGIPMARIELLDADGARAFNAYAKMDFPEEPHLLIEFHGSDSSVAEDAKTFGEVADSHGAREFRWSAKTEDRNRLWRIRHEAYYALKGLRPGAMVLTTDVCVPISKLADAVEETRKDIAAEGLLGPIVGHVGDGNFHCCLLIEPGNEAELRSAKDIAARMNARAIRLGGTITGEHGVGMGKMRYMAEQHGAAWGTMATIKRSLDPKNILNPGKMVEIN